MDQIGPLRLEASDAALAAYVHVINARPLFGVLAPDGAQIVWMAGGSDFAGLLPDEGHPYGRLADLLQRVGCRPNDTDDLTSLIDLLAPGADGSLPHRLTARNGKPYAVRLRRRSAPEDRIVQFTLVDISAFVATEFRTRDVAKALLDRLADALEGGASALQFLTLLEGRLGGLRHLADDAAIAADAARLAADVDRVARVAVMVLAEFEALGDGDGTADDEAGTEAACPAPNLGRALGWAVESPSDPRGNPVWAAYDFVRHSGVTLILAPSGAEIFVLGDDEGDRRYPNLAALIKGLAVEENSRRTAEQFFGGLSEKADQVVLSMDSQAKEARGRPLASGGWQAAVMPASTDAVDLRGLFHGFKNLLLHMQVLHVVKTRRDLEQVEAGLLVEARHINERLAALRAIAKTGRRHRIKTREVIGDWLAAGKRVGAARDGQVDVVASSDLQAITLQATPGEMEDAIGELVRNAFQHGAKVVRITARRQGCDLQIAVADDGRGMDGAHLTRLRAVIDSGLHDPSLSTRQDGTGNGVLAVAKAVRRFVNGSLSVRSTAGQGTTFEISFKLVADP